MVQDCFRSEWSKVVVERLCVVAYGFQGRRFLADLQVQLVREGYFQTQAVGDGWKGSG